MRERGFRYAPEEKLPFPVIYLPMLLRGGFERFQVSVRGYRIVVRTAANVRRPVFFDTGRPKKSLTAESRYPFPKTSASVLIFDKTLPEQISRRTTPLRMRKKNYIIFYEERPFCRVETVRPQNRLVRCH